MARALIVGCGCRGRQLGRALAGEGWRVRGTTREELRLKEIAEAGLEAAVADPDRPGSILDLAGDVTLIFWVLGSARGELETIAAIHGQRLERLLEKLVDSPVRGFVYEGDGTVADHRLARGAGVVRAAGDRWRIPVEIVAADPEDPDTWTGEMLAAARRLTGAA